MVHHFVLFSLVSQTPKEKSKRLNIFLPLLSTFCILQTIHVCFQTLQDTARSLAKQYFINEFTNALLKAAYFTSLMLKTDVRKF